MFIPDPDLDFLPIPVLGVKKASDPGSGSTKLTHLGVLRSGLTHADTHMTHLPPVLWKQIRIRLSMPILIRILSQVLNMLENLNFFAFIQRDASLHCFIILVIVMVDVILSVFFEKPDSLSSHLVETDTDPANDADPTGSGSTTLPTSLPQPRPGPFVVIFFLIIDTGCQSSKRT
jgi:hypothetical protein